jgi:hypothetical protein
MVFMMESEAGKLTTEDIEAVVTHYVMYEEGQRYRNDREDVSYEALQAAIVELALARQEKDGAYIVREQLTPAFFYRTFVVPAIQMVRSRPRG